MEKTENPVNDVVKIKEPEVLKLPTTEETNERLKEKEQEKERLKKFGDGEGLKELGNNIDLNPSIKTDNFTTTSDANINMIFQSEFKGIQVRKYAKVYWYKQNNKIIATDLESMASKLAMKTVSFDAEYLSKLNKRKASLKTLLTALDEQPVHFSSDFIQLNDKKINWRNKEVYPLEENDFILNHLNFNYEDLNNIDMEKVKVFKDYLLTMIDPDDFDKVIELFINLMLPTNFYKRFYNLQGTKIGNDGKSSFMEIITRAFGGIDVNIDFSTKQKGKDPKYTLQAQFLTNLELKQLYLLDFEKVKNYRGNDNITIDPKYAEQQSGRIAGTIILGTNNTQSVYAEDRAVVNSLVTINFNKLDLTQENDFYDLVNDDVSITMEFLKFCLNIYLNANKKEEWLTVIDNNNLTNESKIEEIVYNLFARIKPDNNKIDLPVIKKEIKGNYMSVNNAELFEEFRDHRDFFIKIYGSGNGYIAQRLHNPQIETFNKSSME